VHSWQGDSTDYSLSVDAGRIHSTEQNGSIY
jgi:hypothetical protein